MGIPKTPQHKMHGFENMSNFITEMLNNPELQSQWKHSNWRSNGRCNRKNQENTSTKICIPLRRFNAEQVHLSMNKAGLITVTASKETTEDSARNGQRKMTETNYYLHDLSLNRRKSDWFLS